MLFPRGEGGGGGKGPRRPSRVCLRLYEAAESGTGLSPVPRDGKAVKSAEGSFPFRVLRFELQRGVGIGTVLVRTRAFVDGLEERSAVKGIQIFIMPFSA